MTKPGFKHPLKTIQNFVEAQRKRREKEKRGSGHPETGKPPSRRWPKVPNNASDPNK